MVANPPTTLRRVSSVANFPVWKRRQLTQQCGLSLGDVIRAEVSDGRGLEVESYRVLDNQPYLASLPHRQDAKLFFHALRNLDGHEDRLARARPVING